MKIYITARPTTSASSSCFHKLESSRGDLFLIPSLTHPTPPPVVKCSEAWIQMAGGISEQTAARSHLVQVHCESSWLTKKKK